jgi:hypothetical protein
MRPTDRGHLLFCYGFDHLASAALRLLGTGSCRISGENAGSRLY